MKDKRVFFNPLRMLSPKLDSEAAKIDELHLIQVSEAFTLEEGLVVMLSKLMEMTRLLEIGFIKNCPKEIEACDQLADDVHKQEKLLTGNLACSVDIPPELCKLIIIFPGHLERVGDLLQSVLNCVRIKCREDVPFGDKAYEEIQKMFDDTIDLMSNFRDALIAPNKFLLEHVISQQAVLDQKCQDWQLAHIDRLLDGSASPRSSSLYLDMLESTQGVIRHIKEMAMRMLTLMSTQAEV
jgi:Na+/phosphate symporter